MVRGDESSVAAQMDIGDGNALGEVAISARVSVRPGSSVSAAALTAFCRERLAGYKVPRTVIVVEYGEAAHQAAEFASS